MSTAPRFPRNIVFRHKAEDQYHITMNDHDFDRPYLDRDAMDTFTAVQTSDARRFGKTVKAFSLSNREYQHRFNNTRLSVARGKT